MTLASLLAALLAAPLTAAEPADLLLTGGRVFVSPGRYASAVAVSGNRVVAVGTDKDLAAYKGPQTRVIALKGRAVTPGFHDAHVHLLKGALFLTQVDLNGATTMAELQRRVGEFAATHPDGWILGRGWDETALPGGKMPTKEDLDAVISTRPVALTDVDGHKMWLNTRALALAGLKDRTSKPLKGDFTRDAKGKPAGVLLEDAMQLATKVIPVPDRAAKLDALRKALAAARENGVTAFDSMQGIVDTAPEEQLSLWRELYEKGEVTARLVLYGRLEDPKGFVKLRKAAADLPRTRVLPYGLKGFVDGVIGARTAALLAPYFDAPETKGEPKMSAAALAALVRAAHKEGLQVALHAVGDRAVRMALDACESSVELSRKQSAEVLLPEYPCRVEHIEVVDASDVDRFEKLKVGASMQPTHMTYDDEIQNYNPNRLGDRVKLSFAWKTMEDAGALLAFGTDWPVMPLAPRLALFAATTRMHFNGKPQGGWIPGQKLALGDAIVHYTAGPARLVGLGSQLGEIKKGYIADLVVFDQDLFKVSGMDLLKVQVDATIYDGKVVFERK